MKLLERLADIIILRRRWVVSVVLAVTAVAGYGLTKIQLNADFSTYLRQSSPLVRAYNYIGDAFGGNSIGLVLVTAPDVFEPEVVGAIDRLTAAYRNVDGIAYVTSVTNVVDFRKVEGGIEVGRLVARGELPRTEEDSGRLRTRVMGTDRFVGNLVSEDGTAAAIMLRFAGGAGDGMDRFNTALRVRDATDAVTSAEALPEEIELYYGGMPFLIYNMTLLVSENMTVLAPLMVVVLLLVLFVGIRAWGGVVYPLTVVLVSTIWTVGLMGFLGLRMDLLSGIMPVILIALGSADGIHFMKRFYERRGAGDSPPEATRTTYTEIGVPLVVTTLTTMVGFASLAISDFAVIRQFGLLTALGLFLALVVTLTLLPALASYGAGRAHLVRRLDGRALTAGLSRFVYRRPGTILVGSGVVVAVGLLGVPRIVKDVDWTLCLQKGSAPFHAEMLLREKFGGSLPVQIVVDGDLKDPATLSAMRAVERRLDALPLASNSQSIAGVIAEMNEVMNDRFTPPDERAGVANLWLLVEDEEMMNQLVAMNDGQGLIQARLANWHTASVTEAVDSVSSFLEALPPKLAVLDPSALPEDQRQALLAVRRPEFSRKLSWDLAGREIEVGADRIEPIVASLFAWKPQENSFTTLREAVRQYGTSPESEVALSAAEARRLAVLVAQQWEAGDPPPPEALTRAVEGVVSGVDPWDAEQLALSLDLLGREAMGSARVDTALAALERVAPAIRTDEILRRNVRGTLWEASGPLWTVDAATAESIGISGGPGVLRIVESRFARSGMASVLKQMEEELTPTQVESVLITLAVVAVLLGLIFHSWVGGILALAPLVVTILVNFGVMGFLEIGLDSFTAMVASIAIGLGIDYAIHFTHRLRRELATAAGDAEEALQRTLATSGVAIIVNAASVGLGFLVLLAAGGQHIRRFGGLSSLTMFVAAALTLTLLPALFLRLRPRFLEQEAPSVTTHSERGEG
ncbi:MAG: hypothetical protein BMS9Abin29_0337 [Gemmatimonadota bacterium]|nr:MAG: hypothetical protein BMS9Abin29_0337 [Gemmatimonadota bacterium]